MFGLLMMKMMLVVGKLCRKRNKPINQTQMRMSLMTMDMGLLVHLQEMEAMDLSLM